MGGAGAWPYFPYTLSDREFASLEPYGRRRSAVAATASTRCASSWMRSFPPCTLRCHWRLLPAELPS